MDSKLIQELESELLKEKDKLVSELKSFARPDSKMKGDWDSEFPKFEAEGSGSHASLEEEADEVEEYESRLGVEYSLESRLGEVNKALERVKKSDYGICGKCKKEIDIERLKANPAAEFCVEHS